MKAPLYRESMALMKKEISQEDIEIGNRLREMRAGLDISGDKLAKKIGVSRGAVGNWERGQGIKRENIQKIAAAFEISFDWLATGTGSMRAAKPASFDGRVNKIRLRRPDLAAVAEAAIEGVLRSVEERDEEKNQ